MSSEPDKTWFDNLEAVCCMLIRVVMSVISDTLNPCRYGYRMPKHYTFQGLIDRQRRSGVWPTSHTRQKKSQSRLPSASSPSLLPLKSITLASSPSLLPQVRRSCLSSPSLLPLGFKISDTPSSNIIFNRQQICLEHNTLIPNPSRRSRFGMPWSLSSLSSMLSTLPKTCTNNQ
jgi:hypothetical protein